MTRPGLRRGVVLPDPQTVCTTLVSWLGGASRWAMRILAPSIRLAALTQSGDNQRVAAEQLGMDRRSLTRTIRDLGLQERGRSE